MENLKSNWSQNQLKAYVILFIGNTMYNSQKHLPLSLNQLGVTQIEFDAINKEFKTDSNYQSIQKICAMVENNKISKDQLFSLIDFVKNMFKSAKKSNKYIIPCHAFRVGTFTN